MGTSKRPSRRPLRREEGENVRSNARSTISVETVARKPAQPVSAAAIIAALESELAREKGARVLDADRMGEMLVRIAESENQKRRAELSAKELSERLGTLEVELGQLRISARDRGADAASSAALAASEQLLRDERAESTLLHERVTRLESESNRMVTQLELAEASTEAAHEQLTAVRAELDAARVTESRLNDELAIVRSALENAMAAADEGRAAEATMRAELDERRAERERHESELGELLAQVEETRRALEDARGEQTRLSSELALSIGDATRSAADARAAMTAASEAAHTVGEKNAMLERVRVALEEFQREERQAALARAEALARALAAIEDGAAPIEPDPSTGVLEPTRPAVSETTTPDAPSLPDRPALDAGASSADVARADALPEIPSFSEFAPPGPAMHAATPRRPSRAPRRSPPPKTPPTLPVPAGTVVPSEAFAAAEDLVLDSLDIEE